jgi:hypothetical protein
VTAFDFHVHHSSSGGDIKVIREELEYWHDEPDDDKQEDTEDKKLVRTRLWGGPYVITQDPAGESQLSADGRKWLETHRWQKLAEWAKTFNQKEEDDPDRALLPRSQMHELRAALFEGPKSFDARLKLIQHRNENTGLELLAGEGEAFREEGEGEERVMVSSLLDAITLAKLGVGEGSSGSDTE